MSELLADIKAAAAADPERAYKQAGYTGQLKRVGPHLVGLCPFHAEKTASFKVKVGGDPQHVGTWYCHGGCKTGGSIVDFYLGLRGASRLTRDLVVELGEKLGLEVGAQSGRGGEPEATYDYQDAKGGVVFQSCRYSGKRFSLRRPDGKGGWIPNMEGVDRVLYRLPLLVRDPDALVVICEGEKDADRVNALSFEPWEAGDVVATTNSEGAGCWKAEHTAGLEGRERVAILVDNDNAGREHAEKVARAVVGVVGSVKVVALPGLPEAGDVSDYLDAGHSLDDLLSVIAETPAWKPSEQPTAEPEEEGKQGRKSQAVRLVELVEESGAELFRNEVGDPYARVERGGHHEVWRVGTKSKRCRRWIAGMMREAEGIVPEAKAVAAALNVIEGDACAGPERRLQNRVARLDGDIWYDLADDRWRAVRVTGEGWNVVDDPPALFERFAHQAAQVEPDGGGDVSDLLGFVNVTDPGDQLLLLVYLVTCFVPDIPHPVPVIIGPPGSAKTTLLRCLRCVVDPSAMEVLSFPYEEEATALMMAHHWTPYFDNVRALKDWRSDMLCRAVTGQGFSKRELWTDQDEVIFVVRRCIALTGVNAGPRQSDLLDRCIFFSLPEIREQERRTEGEFWSEFQAARPGLVGGAFNTLAAAMKLLPSVRVVRPPRMADFAVWGCAVAQALGSSQAAFLAAYAADQGRRHDEAIRASPVGEVMLALVEEQRVWEGTPSELLDKLTELAESQQVNTKQKEWPKAPQALTRRLNEIRSNLAAAGVRIDSDKGRRRRVRVERMESEGEQAREEE